MVAPVAQRSTLTPFFCRVRGEIKPGAHRMQTLLAPLATQGIFELPCILVTGTNGKGTVCALLESALRHCGLRTGLYTSPHLVHPGERIRVNGQPIQEDSLSQIVEEVNQLVAKHLPDATFFEIVTAAACIAFLREKVEVVVCEIGLGGRYDSTNVLRPLVSVMTSVALEHTELLGDTEFAIAFDKAHISRRNHPLVLGHVGRDARRGIDTTLVRTGAHVINGCQPLPSKYAAIAERVAIVGSDWLRLNADNLQIALASLQQFEQESGIELDPQSLTHGVLATRWPGRFDTRVICGKEVIFDASHNAAGFQFLLNQYARSRFALKRCHVLYASLNDKDWRTTLHLLPRIAQDVIFTAPTSERAVPAGTLGAEVALGVDCRVETVLENALKFVLSHEDGLPVLITGSIAFVGEAMEILHIDPFADNEVAV